MEDQEDRAPRLRDLGEARQPYAGVPEVGRVGEVGELPYAIDEVGDHDRADRNPRVLLIGLAVVLIVAIAIAIVVALVA